MHRISGSLDLDCVAAVACAFVRDCELRVRRIAPQVVARQLSSKRRGIEIEVREKESPGRATHVWNKDSFPASLRDQLTRLRELEGLKEEDEG